MENIYDVSSIYAPAENCENHLQVKQYLFSPIRPPKTSNFDEVEKKCKYQCLEASCEFPMFQGYSINKVIKCNIHECKK